MTITGPARGLVVLLASLAWPAALAAQLGTGPGPDDLSPEVLFKEAPRRPNVLLIMADDLGYGDLGCFGSDYILTPELDQLAAEGIRLTQFRTNSAGCTPSRVSLLTGTMTVYHGFQAVATNQTRRGIPDAVRTLPEVFRSGGYTTGHVGKWHVGEAEDAPTDEFLPPSVGFDRSARLHIPDQQTHWNPEMVLDEKTSVEYPGLHSTRVLTDYALEFIEDQDGKDKPWFLNLWYYAPHLPMQVPAAYLSLYPDSEPQHPWTKFAAMVSQMDEGIGELLDKLDELGMTDDTLVLVFSDNGGSLSPGLHPDGNGPLKGGKAQHYEGGIRVPFIARWPGVIEPNTGSPEEVFASDVLPTALELTGRQEFIPHVEGRSMLRTLRGYASPPRTQEFYWSGKASASPIAPPHGITDIFAVRQDHTSIGGQDLKLVFGAGFDVEMYDMDADPLETTNVADVYPGKKFKLWNNYWQKRSLESVIDWTPAFHGESFPTGDGSFAFFNGLVDFPSDAWMDFHNGNFTAQVVARVQQVGVEQVLMSKEGSFELVIAADDRVRLTLWDDQGGTEVVTAPNPLALGQVVDIAWTVSRWTSTNYDNTVTLYLDTVAVATGTVPAVDTNRNDVRIGNDDAPPFGTRPFRGALSGLTFRNVALHPLEVAGSWPPVPGSVPK